MTKKRSSGRCVKSYLNKAQRDYLEVIIDDDAAESPNGAVKWCIDSCIAIEKTYNEDALFVGLNDVRADLKKEVEELRKWKKEQIEVWNPVVEFINSNAERLGLTIGDSLSEKAVEIMAEYLATKSLQNLGK